VSKNGGTRIERVQERRDPDCACPRTAGPRLSVDPDCAGTRIVRVQERRPRTAQERRDPGGSGPGTRDQGPRVERVSAPAEWIRRAVHVQHLPAPPLGRDRAGPDCACPTTASSNNRLRTGSCGTGLCVSNNRLPDEPRAKRPADAHRRRSTRLRASVQAAPVNCVPSLRSGSSARTSNGPVHAPSPPGPNSVQDRTVRVQQRRSGPNCACPTTAETRRRAKGRPDEPRAKRPADAHRRRSTRLRASVQAAPVNCVPSLRSGSSARTANGPVHAPSPTPRHRQDRTPGPNPRTELCPGPNCACPTTAQDRTVRIQQRRSNGAA